MNIEQLIDIMKQAAKNVMLPSKEIGSRENLAKDMLDYPKSAEFFNEFGRLYAEATVPGVKELEEALAKAKLWDDRT